MKTKVTKELLEKFFKGKCTAEEEGKVLQWMKDRSDKNMLHKIEQDWMSINEDDFPVEDTFERSFGELQKKINSQPKVIRLKPWMKVAASLLLVASLSLVLFFYDQTKEDAYITKHIQKGNPSVFTFNDGSKVTLSAGSTISYPVKFASNKPVYLEGQAHFDISSDSEVTIFAGNVKARASQSSFNISAFPEDEEVVVSVLEGQAEVTGDKRLLKLYKPKTIPLTKLRPAITVRDNEYLAFNKDEDTLSKGEDFDQKEVSAWKEGVIYFNNADSVEMIKKLERWYGVDITVSGCLGQQTFNGEYAGKSLDEILMTIKTNESPPLEFIRKEDHILINGICI
ncbi:FecR family protein [Fulvivirga sp. M361]|uniref:FecR family protein n=1 Tax=Fulvivirga sp. M361 TaxID=2594266 RepID=UPI001626D9B9|nr:FecR domain-containing protein [Fulvivirga sp. M361]